MIDSVFIAPFITAALFYLGSRAMITEPIWRRYPPKLDAFMSCAACTGYWYGVLVTLIGYLFDVPFLGSHAWYVIPVAGLASVVWTPIVAAKMETALISLSSPTVAPLTIDPAVVERVKNAFER